MDFEILVCLLQMCVVVPGDHIPQEGDAHAFMFVALRSVRACAVDDAPEAEGCAKGLVWLCVVNKCFVAVLLTCPWVTWHQPTVFSSDQTSVMARPSLFNKSLPQTACFSSTTT